MFTPTEQACKFMPGAAIPAGLVAEVNFSHRLIHRSSKYLTFLVCPRESLSIELFMLSLVCYFPSINLESNVLELSYKIKLSIEKTVKE